METTMKDKYRDIEQIWLLMSNAQVRQAQAASEALVQQLQWQYEKRPHERDLLQKLMHAHHIAGYAAAMSTRGEDALVPASYFGEMGRIACILQNEVYVVIARSYQGDMYRRYGDLKQALACLETAYNTPLTDRAAHGNCAQLLGRVYAQQNKQKHAVRLMEEAERLACHDNALQNSLHGYYCLGAVYLDYARYYSKMGHFHKALDFHTQAKITLPETSYWATVSTAVQGFILVEGGRFEQGMPIVVKAVALAQQQGNSYLLDHFYALQRYLGKQTLECNRASIFLGTALHRNALIGDSSWGEFLDRQ